MSSAKVGDIFLLFHQLPYDFEEDLPLAIAPNVFLEHTPQSILEKAEPAITDYVLPGYHIEGTGLTNCCLTYCADKGVTSKFESSYLLFSSITALRLSYPLEINVAGKFEVGIEIDLIRNAELFELCSPWNPTVKNLFYSKRDIKLASDISKLLIQDPVRGYERLTTAIIYFSQVTCGFSMSYQLSILGLFACLEALYTPEGKNKGSTLGRMISQFLSNFTFPFNLAEWIEKEYKNRNKITHGAQYIAPTTKLREPKYKAFGRLHEITRLSILGFLSISDSLVKRLSQSGKRKLQSELDNLPTASGKYIDHQCLLFS